MRSSDTCKDAVCIGRYRELVSMDYRSMNQKEWHASDTELNQNTGCEQPSCAMGLNDTLDFLGTQLHIQTENMEHPTPRIITQVFSKGRIVFSKKTLYSMDVPSIENPDTLPEEMHRQHFQVIQDISEKQKRFQSDLKIQRES
jgi:hypothetical protein